ncbi:MAG TPA: lactate utilization protein [Synergistaceae bacterium]|jgi:L-lactate utilization protein LutB|nr:lactate utilization protein [Synergistaceae bacterium]
MNFMQEKNIPVWKSHHTNIGQTVVKALNAKGYSASYVATAEEAAKAVCDLIPENSTVGVPGTSTIRELNLLELLEEKGCTIFHHWDPSLSPDEKNIRLREELESDFFLTSSNAVTQDGILVNIDGTGNRVAGMAWGTNTLIFVIGVNKICRDLESAIKRVKDTATPPNAIRLNIDVPCAKTGHCIDCNSSSRVCRATLILERPPMGRKVHVFIVGESLGY